MGISSYKKAENVTATELGLVVQSFDTILVNLNKLKDSVPDDPEQYLWRVNAVNEYMGLFSCLDFDLGGDISLGLAELYKFTMVNIPNAVTTESVQDLIDITSTIRAGFVYIQNN